MASKPEKTAKDIISEFYKLPYNQVIELSGDGKLPDDAEIDWGEDEGEEIIDV